MEREELKHARNFLAEQGAEESSHVRDFLLDPNTPSDIIEAILLNTDELSPVEALVVAESLLRLFRRRSPGKAAQLRSELWDRIFVKRFAFPGDAQLWQKQREREGMDEAFLAFLASAYANYVQKTSRQAGQASVSNPTIALGESHFAFGRGEGSIAIILKTTTHETRKEFEIFKQALVLLGRPNGWSRIPLSGDIPYRKGYGIEVTEEEYPRLVRHFVYRLLQQGYRFYFQGKFNPRAFFNWAPAWVKTCVGCNAAEATSVCTGCESAHYCSRACQARHWERWHKNECGCGLY